MRKMASIQVITDIVPIENADAIECAIINGWKIVIKKDEFKIGDEVIYCEIDSWIPHDVAPFLTKDKIKEYEGVQGNRLRTVKLRGCISQGLILKNTLDGTFKVGDDVSELLNIKKYDPPLPACLAGEAKGIFPSFVPKTDEERVQNLVHLLPTLKGRHCYITEKLDGTSFTAYFNDGVFGVCSRNLDLKQTEGNSLWKYAIEHSLQDALFTYGGNIAIQGEFIGSGIQGNKYKKNGHHLYVFNIYDIDAKRYLYREEMAHWCAIFGLNEVPMIKVGEFDFDLESLLEYADGRSVLADTSREGIVIRFDGDTRISFKAISNKWLLKNE